MNPTHAPEQRAQAGHTPLPWYVETFKTSVGHCHKIQPVAACIYIDHRNANERDVKTLTAAANAALIVRAVNSLEALVEALKFYVSICGNTCYSVTRETAREMYEQASKALALAEGGAS